MRAEHKYWFCLEPNVFIFKSKTLIVLYDHLAKHKLELRNNNAISKILDYLSEPSNMYVCPISQAELEDERVSDFVYNCCDCFMANLIPSDQTGNKPVLIPPVLKLHIDKEEIDVQNLTMDALDEITFYINGQCNAGCPGCKNYHLQFDCCSENQGEIDLRHLEALAELLKEYPKIKINITGGNLFLFEKLKKLSALLSTLRNTVDFRFNYLNFVPRIYEAMRSETGWNYVIYIQPPFDVEKLREITRMGEVERAEFRFIVMNSYEIDEVDRLVEDPLIGIINYSIVPYYNGGNQNFFEECVYVDNIDLWEESPSKKEIFARQKINTSDFGKLSVYPDGRIYANRNFKSIGNLEQGLMSAILEEIENGNSWFRIRDGQPCCQCAYQWLCPSPSGYELALGKNNLCNIASGCDKSN